MKTREKVLIVGSLNMDLVVQTGNMPAIGETVLGKSLRYIPGGKGANQAYAAGNLGADVIMLGCVGADEFGKIQKEELSKAGVNTEHMKIASANGTGTAIVNLDAKGNNSIVVIQGANLECDVSYLMKKEELIRECDYILLQMEIPCESIYYAIEKAHTYGKVVILNPAPAPDAIPDKILAMIDYLTPNETELLKLAGMEGMDQETLVAAAEKLIHKGVGKVIATLGDKGALMVSQEGNTLFPAEKVKAVDTTAAGDCFNGALLVALSEGKRDEEAIWFANTAASLAVTKMGAFTSIPKREEVESKVLPPLDVNACQSARRGEG